MLLAELSFNLKEWISTAGIFLLLALIPFVLILMTSFTRISIILTFLRQALGTSVPSTQIIIGLSLILTGYVMHPVFEEIYDRSVQPYFEQKSVDEKTAIQNAWPPLESFMLKLTREKDLELFLNLAPTKTQENIQKNPESLPWYLVVPAFVLSELRTAFMIGFLIFLPFLIIDMLVTSILMSMGMVMLPPVVISFPFKLLLFVLVDGWHLIVYQLVHSY